MTPVMIELASFELTVAFADAAAALVAPAPPAAAPAPPGPAVAALLPHALTMIRTSPTSNAAAGFGTRAKVEPPLGVESDPKAGPYPSGSQTLIRLVIICPTL
jgi:hypothetical protein